MSTEMIAKPQQEHQWLEKLVGEWIYESEGIMGDGQPPMKAQGTETVRSLGGLWIVCEGKSQMPDGQPQTTLMTLGYNPKTKSYVGTWKLMKYQDIIEFVSDDHRILRSQFEGEDGAWHQFMTAHYRRQK